MPEVIQLKILKQYEGQSIGKALYAIEVAEGYYKCREIQRELEKLCREK